MCAVAYYSANTAQQSLIANSTILCRLTMDGEYNLDEEVTINGMCGSLVPIRAPCRRDGSLLLQLHVVLAIQVVGGEVPASN